MTAPITAARASSAPARMMCTGWLLLAIGLLAGSCIDNTSVGVSPLATVDASVTATQDAGPAAHGGRDAGGPLDSGARSGEAGPLVDAAIRDAAAHDATARDAAEGDAAATDAATDAASSRQDAGKERCDERLCAIAGIAPVDDDCPKGKVSACLREQSGQCAWYCL
jgi:hypothetical protein